MTKIFTGVARVYGRVYVHTASSLVLTEGACVDPGCPGRSGTFYLVGFCQFPKEVCRRGVARQEDIDSLLAQYEDL